MKMPPIWFPVACWLSGLLLALGIAMPGLRAAETVLTADVMVYSANPCGVAAAVAAARMGRSVLLIEPTQHVGGLSTSGINTAETEHMLKWTIGGISLEFYERLGAHYGTGKPEFYFESGVAEEVMSTMLREAAVPVRYGAAVATVTKEGARIRAITLTDGVVVTARQFIDASYEGDLMARAGVTWVAGREGRDEFGEEGAGVRLDRIAHEAKTVDATGHLLPGISAWAKDLQPGVADPVGMNFNFRLIVTNDPAQSVPFPSPANYDRGRYQLLENWLQERAARGEKVKTTDVLDFYARRNQKFELNNKQAAIISLGYFGGQADWPAADYATREKIYADHKDYTLGLIYFLGHDESVPADVRTEMGQWGLDRREFRDNGNFPYQLYVREARRMRGAYVMTQRDITDERRKPDAVAMNSHHIDGHHVRRVALTDSKFLNEGRLWRRGFAYQVPYRALVPVKAQCENLLVPCAASFTHVAFCTLRLESEWMGTGHAAGVAASLALTTSRAVQDIEIPALQALLREQRQVIDFIPGQQEKNEEVRGPEEF